MRVQKENVQRVVESQEVLEQMLNDGWEEVKVIPKKLEDMTIKELQAYLKEKGIEFEKGAKKEELLALAKADDNEEGVE